MNEVDSKYRALIRLARLKQLKSFARSMDLIEAQYDAKLGDLKKHIEQVPDEPGQYEKLIAIADLHLNALRAEYSVLLNAGMLDGAQQAATRELQTAELLKEAIEERLKETKTLDLSSIGLNVKVKFGVVSDQAVRAAAERVYSDGWKLTDRLGRLDAYTRQTIQQAIVQGVQEQQSARDLAKRIRESLSQAGVDNPRYRAMRIARTEINTAHREAHILSCCEEGTLDLKSYISAVGWRLSASHPHTDICDVWSSDDTGLGEGNFLPEDVPSDHCHGLCYTISVLAAYPDVSSPSKAAIRSDVPEAQARYYSNKYDDPTAQRWLEQYGVGDEL